MFHVDRTAWGAAQSLHDCASVMRHQLDHQLSESEEGLDPDLEELLDTLAACNDAGYLTTDAFLGARTPTTRQRAAVCGFAHDQLADRIEGQATAAGLLCHRWRTTRKPAGDWRAASLGTPVSTGGAPGALQFGFGGWASHHHVRQLFHGVSKKALVDIFRAWQISVIDPEWGRNDRIWGALCVAVGC